MRAYYSEIDPFAAQWLRNLIGAGLIAEGDVDERDIRDVHPDDLRGYTQCHFFAGIGVWSYALRQAGWDDSRPVWTGSCPCQPFSAAGRREGFADERHLWPHFHHLIRECRPPVVFGEQVASKDGLAWLDLVRSDLEGEGYACGAVDLCAAGVGAPHIRQRLYWVADSEGKRQPRPLEVAGRKSFFGGQGEPAERRGNAGGVADPESERRHGVDDPAGAAGRDGAEERGPVNRFWRHAEWLPCRDGKFRAAQPGTFPLAHGAPARVVRACPSCLQKGTVDERLQKLLEAIVRNEGRLTPEVLQSGMYAEGLPEAAINPRSGPQSSASIVPNGSVRSVRDKGEAGKASPRRGRDEQQPRECSGSLPEMPSVAAPKDSAAFNLRSMRSRIPGGVPSESEQNLLCEVCGGMGSDLLKASMATSRVGRLRGYGNAIVAPAAQAFIEAYLECRP